MAYSYSGVVTLRFLLIACLLCCSTAKNRAGAPCVTRCGLVTRQNCAELQAVENKAVKHFAGLEWGDEAAVCRALSGWEVYTHTFRPSDEVACNPGAWPIDAGFCILGFTHEGARSVELPHSRWAEGVLAHELVHVLDITLQGHAGHCDWEAKKIKAALKKIQGGREDHTPPESICAP